MNLNIAVIAKAANLALARARTSSSIAGLHEVVVDLVSDDNLLTRGEDTEQAAIDKVLALRRSMTSRGVKPLTSNWRVIISQDEETKLEQTRWAKRLGRIRSHPNSWGFTKGKSCRDCCQSHLVYWGIEKPGQMSMVSLDVENFFPSITGDMIRTALEAHGFNEEEINRCINLCTFKVDKDHVWSGLLEVMRRTIDSSESKRANGSLGDLIGEPVLNHNLAKRLKAMTCGYQYNTRDYYYPCVGKFAREIVFRYLCGFGRNTEPDDRILIQGSPASPVLSNLVMKSADYRLAALAKARGAFYSRYADDITFSWKKRRGKKWIALLTYSAGKILNENNLFLRNDKTIIKGPGMRQSMLGYNLNAGKITVSRGRRSRVEGLLRKAADGRQALRPDTLESLMGEVEFISTAHPGIADELRELGARALERMGITGRTQIHFGDENHGLEDLEHQTRSEDLHQIPYQ